MRRALLIAAVVSCCAAPITARAVDVDWFGGVTLSDGGRNFLNLSVAHFDADQRELTPVIRRLPRPEEDMPVLLFLARESHRSPEVILDLRLRGMTWWDVMLHVGVPPARMFVAVPTDPGPPYGKAWGYYRKHPRERRGATVLNDRQVCDLVGAQVVGRAYGVEPAVVLEARRHGTRVVDYAVVRERERNGRGREVAASERDGDGDRRESRGGPDSAHGGQGRGKGGGRGRGDR
jgi:hypothetical protein